MKRLYLLCVTLLLFVAIQLKAQEIVENPIDCFECHTQEDLTMELEDGEEISIFIAEETLKNSVHGEITCASCHLDIKDTHPDDEVGAQPVKCARCHDEQSHSYGVSVHGEALAAGDDAAATCVDCHQKHDIRSSNDPESPLFWTNEVALCGECHFDVALQLEESVHGEALSQNRREAPICTDCHFEHEIRNLATASTLTISREVCSRCHESERLNTRFGIPGDRVQTFFESYHGLAAEYGSASAANCASCHGYHHILPSSDPRSSIHADHLQETCGKCHPDATSLFVQSKVHVSQTMADDLGGWLNIWVRRIYLMLIFGTIGGMFIHNFLCWRRKIQASLGSPRDWVRMDTNQRWQHQILVVSFVVLALSGFALEYPHTWLGWMFGSDEGVRRLFHRVAAVILLGLGAYHIGYIIITRNGRRLVRDLLPRFQDFRDLMANLRFFMKAQSGKPLFGRFGYPEKAEYWAVFWGTAIMGLTGFMLWFTIGFTHWLPRWVIDIAKTVHYYEAILAILAILVWHVYHVMLDPDVYPMNWAWWDGRVDKKWYRHEHGGDPELGPIKPEADQDT